MIDNRKPSPVEAVVTLSKNQLQTENLWIWGLAAGAMLLLAPLFLFKSKFKEMEDMQIGHLRSFFARKDLNAATTLLKELLPGFEAKQLKDERSKESLLALFEDSIEQQIQGQEQRRRFSRKTLLTYLPRLYATMPRPSVHAAYRKLTRFVQPTEETLLSFLFHKANLEETIQKPSHHMFQNAIEDDILRTLLIPLSNIAEAKQYQELILNKVTPPSSSLPFSNERVSQNRLETALNLMKSPSASSHLPLLQYKTSELSTRSPRPQLKKQMIYKQFKEQMRQLYEKAEQNPKIKTCMQNSLRIHDDSDQSVYQRLFRMLRGYTFGRLDVKSIEATAFLFTDTRLTSYLLELLPFYQDYLRVFAGVSRDTLHRPLLKATPPTLSIEAFIERHPHLFTPKAFSQTERQVLLEQFSTTEGFAVLIKLVKHHLNTLLASINNAPLEIPVFLNFDDNKPHVWYNTKIKVPKELQNAAYLASLRQASQH